MCSNSSLCLLNHKFSALSLSLLLILSFWEVILKHGKSSWRWMIFCEFYTMVWKFLSLQNSFIENLMPKLMALGGETFGRWLVPYKRCRRAGSVLPSHEVSVRDLLPGRGLSLSHAGTLVSDVQPSGLWEVNFCCLQAPQSVVFCYSSPTRVKISYVPCWQWR